MPQKGDFLDFEFEWLQRETNKRRFPRFFIKTPKMNSLRDYNNAYRIDFSRSTEIVLWLLKILKYQIYRIFFITH